MIEFVEYSREFLEKSWEWLNDKEIKDITMTPDFTKEQQEKFFNSLPGRTDYLIKGILYDSVPVGACGMKNITEKDAEVWTYLGEKEFWGKGIGKEITKFLIQWAKDKGLESIYWKTYEWNERAKSLYIKSGCTIEKVENGIVLARFMLS